MTDTTQPTRLDKLVGEGGGAVDGEVKVKRKKRKKKEEKKKGRKERKKKKRKKRKREETTVCANCGVGTSGRRVASGWAGRGRNGKKRRGGQAR